MKGRAGMDWWQAFSGIIGALSTSPVLDIRISRAIGDARIRSDAVRLHVV
jgi:hypothetical protein